METEFDSPWKEAINLYFKDFLEFFFPEIHADIDWNEPPQFLESELRAVTREAEQGRRHADSLVQVRRRCGTSQLVLIHIEVQSQVDSRFTQRMLLYHTRIADRFAQPVCSLAILGDMRRKWRPCCNLKLEFLTRKLLDYSDWASHTKNPFGWLTAAHLQAQATRRQPKKRAETKFRLIRGLYQCGLARNQLLELFRLLDWVMALSKNLEYAFRQDLALFEKENDMVYITSVERIIREEIREEAKKEVWEEARKEAREEARKEARKEAWEEARKVASEEVCQTVRATILGQHTERFGELDATAQGALMSIQDHARLVELLTQLLSAPSSQAWKAKL